MNTEQVEFFRTEGRRVGEPDGVRFGRLRHEAQVDRARNKRLARVRQELMVIAPNITIVMPENGRAEEHGEC